MTKPPDTVIDQPIAREIAMRTGAVRVMFGTVTGSNKLNIDIQQPDNWPTRYRDHWQKSFSLVNFRLKRKERNHLSRTPNCRPEYLRLDTVQTGRVPQRHRPPRHPPEGVTPSNWEALESYSEANLLLRENRPADAVVKLQK